MKVVKVKVEGTMRLRSGYKMYEPKMYELDFVLPADNVKILFTIRRMLLHQKLKSVYKEKYTRYQTCAIKKITKETIPDIKIKTLAEIEDLSFEELIDYSLLKGVFIKTERLNNVLELRDKAVRELKKAKLIAESLEDTEVEEIKDDQSDSGEFDESI